MTAVRQPWPWHAPTAVAGLLLLAALIFPLVSSLYAKALAIELMIFAILAISLNLLLGYTGLPSLGQAAFFGLGAYLTAYLASNSPLALGLTTNLLLLVPLVIVATAVVALLIGLFALRTSGVYFLMITLAFAQMLFSIAIRWTAVTGGSDGLGGIPPALVRLGWWQYTLSSREDYYFVTLFFLLATFLVLRQLINSPFGLTLCGIRENEPRLIAMGYHTFFYKLAAFAISGALAGLAGLLWAIFFRHVSPDTLYWTVSGQLLVMVIIGGNGTLVGPILGAAVLSLFPHLTSSAIERWQTLEGILFILFVLYAPKGIVGLWQQWRHKQA